VPVTDTPLIFTENAVHNKELRRKLTEFMFESEQVPALFICKDAVLSSFACGRSTSLVLDCGAERTTATPVNDGYALQKCLMQIGVGGSRITDQLMQWITEEQKTPVRPRYTFKRKLIKSIDNQEAFELIQKDCPYVHHSYYTWCQQEIVRQIKEDIMYVAEEQMEGIGAATQVRSQTFELPDG